MDDDDDTDTDSNYDMKIYVFIPINRQFQKHSVPTSQDKT